MPKVVVCTNCGMQLGIPETTAGQLVQCPSCLSVFSVPETAGGQRSEVGSQKSEVGGQKSEIGRLPTSDLRPPTSDLRPLTSDEQVDPGAGRELASKVLWVLVSVLGLILIGGGVFLAWYLAESPAPEPKLALEVKKQFANVPHQEISKEVNGFPKETPAIPSIKEEVPPSEPKNEEIKKVEPEPQKELPAIDHPKKHVPKTADPKMEGPKQVEPPKDEIIIGGEGWFEVHSIQGRFYVALPALPLFQPIEDPNEDHADAEHAGPGYMAKHPRADLVFRAGAIQLQGKIAPDPWEAYVIPMVRGQLRGFFQITGKKEINLDGPDRRQAGGWEFLALTSQRIGVAGRFFHLEQVAGKPRMFFFTVTGPGVRLDAPDVRKFFKSVKLEKGDIFLTKKKDLPIPEDQGKPHVRGETGAKDQPDKKPAESKSAGAPARDARLPGVKKSGPNGLGRAGLIVAGEVGKIAGKLNAHLGAVFDLEAKAGLLLLPGGQAKLYAYPEFMALGNYKLAAGSAYRPIYDKAKGRLFVLTPNPKAKDPGGRPGGSQVVIYEIRALLEGRLNPHTEVPPAKTIQLGGFCSQLCLSPDGAWLYVLETASLKAPRVIRVDVAKGEQGAAALVPEFTDRLSLARGGKTLYALSHLAARTAKGPPPEGAVLVIDPEAMTLKKTVNVPIDPFDMEATKDGIVFISGHGGVRSEIVVVDVNNEAAVLASWKGVPPGSCLKLSEDERRLYVSNWKGTPATVAALAVPDVLAGSELPKAQWAQSPPVPARGEMTITPDNQYLLCDSGVVFFLGSADKAEKIGDRR